jgi:hypothetical protein
VSGNADALWASEFKWVIPIVGMGHARVETSIGISGRLVDLDHRVFPVHFHPTNGGTLIDLNVTRTENAVGVDRYVKDGGSRILIPPYAARRRLRNCDDAIAMTPPWSG